MMSSNLSGLSFFIISRKPLDSSWNTPVVSPREIISNTPWSSMGILADVERLLTGRGPLLVDELDRGLDDGEGLEAEEVELDQPGLLDLLHRELGDDLAVLAAEARHVAPTAARRR